MTDSGEGEAGEKADPPAAGAWPAPKSGPLARPRQTGTGLVELRFSP